MERILPPRPRAEMRFVVTKGGEFLGGLTVGRLQVPKGFDPLGALKRRLLRDTGLHVVTLLACSTTRGEGGEVLRWHFELEGTGARAGASASVLHVTAE